MKREDTRDKQAKQGIQLVDICEPNTLSFACLAAWFLIVFFSGNLVSHFGGTQFLLDWSFQATFLALTVISGIVACLARFFDRLMEKRATAVVGSFLVLTGMAVSFTLDQLAGTRSFSSMIVFSCFSSCGILICMLELGFSYRHLGGHLAAKTASLGLLLAYMLYTIALILPDMVSFILMGALPPLSILALRRVAPTLPHEDFTRKEQFSYRRLVVNMGVSCFVFAFSFSLLRYFNTQDWMLLADKRYLSFVFGFALVAFYVLATIVVRLTVCITKRIELGYLYRVVLLYYILGLFGYPVALTYGLPGGTLGPNSALSVGFIYFATIVWIVMADVLFRENVSPSRVLALGVFLVTFGVSGGFLVGLCLPVDFAAQPLDAFIICVVLVIATFLVYSYLFTEKSVCIMGNGDASREFIEERHLERTCDEIAKKYHLSPRESDVLYLMACGKTAAEIMDTLVISVGTYNTHSHHIYQKLGIHRRQELNDFIGSWTLGS